MSAAEYISCAAGTIKFVFAATCARQKHPDPPVLPQQNGETAVRRKSVEGTPANVMSDSLTASLLPTLPLSAALRPRRRTVLPAP